MKKEVKDILQLLLLVLPLFGIMVFGWFHSPMYADAIEQNRVRAQIYLAKTYYYSSYVEEQRQMLMDHYGLTEKGLIINLENP